MLIAFVLVCLFSRPSHALAAKAKPNKEPLKKDDDILARAGRRRPDLPSYSYDEVGEHTSREKRIWVTFKEGVYDITDFVDHHPGGETILMAVGGPLEPFWDLYAVHKSAHVFKVLEDLRIGNVLPGDGNKQQPHEVVDYYANEPKRHPDLKPHTEKPFNAETPRKILVDSFLTPNEFFFVRNHFPVPDANELRRNHTLELTGIGLKKPVSLEVSDLKKKFKVYTITTTIPCSGNRRTDMDKTKPVKGLPWDVGAVSTAEWTGVKLSDVLEYVGAEESKVGHVIFQGHDRDIEGLCYEASIPAATAFDPRRDVLLAFEMNGKELPADHGYPLRVVAPGIIGARQVKWLERIVLSEQESMSFWQQKDYKIFNPSAVVEGGGVTAKAIQEYPVQAAICIPEPGSTITDDYLTVKGYAFSGGGKGIIRVDVTIDGGSTWFEAKLHSSNQARHREWAWTIWETSIPLTKEHRGEIEIAVKATDSSHDTQPETDRGLWNTRGLLENKWHRVKVNVNVGARKQREQKKSSGSTCEC